MPIKTTIAPILLQNAIEFIRGANLSKSRSRLDEEIRQCLGTHLMVALALEGVINKVGEVALDSSIWHSLEKSDTILKWYILSGIEGKVPFQLGKEPLQTIKYFYSIRNKIAHPKIEDLGDEIIIGSKNGELKRNVTQNYVIKDGDYVWMGYGKLVDVFNLKKTLAETTKALDAIKVLIKHLKITGMEWIDNLDKKLSEIKHDSNLVS